MVDENTRKAENRRQKAPVNSNFRNKGEDKAKKHSRKTAEGSVSVRTTEIKGIKVTQNLIGAVFRPNGGKIRLWQGLSAGNRRAEARERLLPSRSAPRDPLF